MARSQQTTGKRDREKKKQQQRKEKEEKRKTRKEQKGKSHDDMIAYVDEYGRFSSTPPEKRKEIKAEDIQIHIAKSVDEPADTVHTGTVTFFNEEKGFGFISEGKDQRVFFHYSQLSEPVAEGNKVEFEVERSVKGLVALKIRKV
jgi:cold shock CspA family protein